MTRSEFIQRIVLGFTYIKVYEVSVNVKEKHLTNKILNFGKWKGVSNMDSTLTEGCISVCVCFGGDNLVLKYDRDRRNRSEMMRSCEKGSVYRTNKY